MVGKGGGADVWHTLSPLRVRSRQACAQRGERLRCVLSAAPAVRAAHSHSATHARTAAGSSCALAAHHPPTLIAPPIERCAADTTVGRVGGAVVWHALAALRARSSRAPTQRGERL
eukprot:48084-Prymnesium_polylepis.1